MTLTLLLPQRRERNKMTKNIKKFQSVKQFAISNIKVADVGGVVRIAGYANTKNVADRYGDIPTVYPVLRNYVYDISEYLKNPVLLIDHDADISHVAGRVTKIYEDAIGLYFEAEFSKSDYPLVAHARTVYAEGVAKSISIGGQWYFEDDKNPTHLTLAKILEISLVAIPADPNATVKPIIEKPQEQQTQDGSKDLKTLNAILSAHIFETEIKKINKQFANKQK